MPNPKINRGVIRDPPPTPVKPTIEPTVKPATIKAKFSIAVL
jgi:hypothetical protein